MTNRKKIAVIGSGISGIVSAYLLQQKYDVSIYEACPRLGGHTYAFPIKNDSAVNAIDMGFIVFNLLNYPLFTKFLNALNVQYIPSDMSFAYYDSCINFYYSSDFYKGVFAQKRHFFSPTFWKFLYDIKQFNSRVLSDIKNIDMTKMSLKYYLHYAGFSQFLIESYVLPMGAAIWSCSTEQILSFPAKSFFEFWKNHQLLTLGKRPQWQTIKGSSQSYIDAFLKQFKGNVFTNSKVTGITRFHRGASVHFKDKKSCDFDGVIIATHANDAFRLIDEPNSLEKRLLSVWNYAKNEVCLHTASKVMPPSKNAWASWVVQKTSQNKNALVMTYYMNRLQSITSNKYYFVSLNDPGFINSEYIIHKQLFTHPIYNEQSVKTQSDLHLLNTGPLYFCGSYFGYGFHEDGVKSAVNACKRLGVEL